MLTGKDLGAAVKAAMKLKGVTQQQVAEEFGIYQPSVSAWVRTGRIDKAHLEHLFTYFADVVGPEHWGLITMNFDSVVDRAVEHVKKELNTDGPLSELSLRALSLARRFDALADDEHRRIAYAMMDNTLQQYESLERDAGRTSADAPRAPRKPKRPPKTDR
jgi:transcriptional regulator with XRE-family HTH domain